MEIHEPSPPPAQTHPQTLVNETDRQHLKLLAIFYYIMAGLNLFLSCFGLFYVTFGIVSYMSPEMFEDSRTSQETAQQIASIFGISMTATGGLIFVAAITIGVLQLMSGNRLRTARSRTFCFVVAIITCISSIPLGTILGVFTIVVLSRESVRLRFEQAKLTRADSHAPTYR